MFAVPIHFLDATGFLFLVLRRSSGGWRRSSEPQSGNKGSEATCECPAREEIGKHLCFSSSVQVLQQNSTAMQSYRCQSPRQSQRTVLPWRRKPSPKRESIVRRRNAKA